MLKGLSYLILSSMLLLAVMFLIRNGFKKREESPSWGIVLLLVQIVFFILPFVGIILTNDPCEAHPFELASLRTTRTLWVIFFLSYFVSRFFKDRLSPLLMLFVASQLFAAAVFCTVIAIHFAPMFLILALPGFNLLYLSPVFCLYFLFREMSELSRYLKCGDTRVSSRSKLDKWLIERRFFLIPLLIAPFQLILQVVLYVFGQKPDSLISQFTNSCGFLLSQYQSCSCGGGHYLCSVAANGDKRLVKPTRYGVRQNQRILVNRQLLIANAFENWLEEYCPKLHYPIRKLYDSCGIPVNAWSKRRKLANLIYILMKPLEWLFLLWLYLFDRSPETRIHSQYLPKEELELFKHENKPVA